MLPVLFQQPSLWTRPPLPPLDIIRTLLIAARTTREKKERTQITSDILSGRKQVGFRRRKSVRYDDGRSDGERERERLQLTPSWNVRGWIQRKERRKETKASTLSVSASSSRHLHPWHTHPPWADVNHDLSSSSTAQRTNQRETLSFTPVLDFSCCVWHWEETQTCRLSISWHLVWHLLCNLSSHKHSVKLDSSHSWQDGAPGFVAWMWNFFTFEKLKTD